MTDKQAPCIHCQNAFEGNFCANCGQPKVVRRIDGRYIVSELMRIANFEKGVLFTIKELLLRPGRNVQIFIHSDRQRLVKPIFFIILCSLIYTLAQQLLRFEDGYIDGGGFGESAVNQVFAWIQGNYGYANIIMAVFIALWIKVFFRKYRYNFFEILILLCYVMGMGMLLYTVFGIAESLSGFRILQLGGLLAISYAAWFIGTFFDSKRKLNYLFGLLSYFLGMISSFIGAFLLGLLIDLIIQ
jgi:hypothetical protein